MMEGADMFIEPLTPALAGHQSRNNNTDRGITKYTNTQPDVYPVGSYTAQSKFRIQLNLMLV